jgi:hypothetical protein
VNKRLDVLHLIQDVDWVVGSFIATPGGELLIYLMPAEFGEDELARTASRLASIVKSAELCGLAVDQCDFSFSRYQLVVSTCAAGMLGVVVEAPVSRPALSMATRIALAELPALVASLDAEPDSAPRGLPDGTRAVARLGAGAEHFGARTLRPD